MRFLPKVFEFARLQETGHDAPFSILSFRLSLKNLVRLELKIHSHRYRSSEVHRPITIRHYLEFCFSGSFSLKSGNSSRSLVLEADFFFVIMANGGNLSSYTAIIAISSDC